MNEPSKRIRIAWHSEMRPPELDDLGLYELVQADPLLNYERFDLEILDTRTYGNLAALKQRYSTCSGPTVVIVDTIKEETDALGWLAVGHERCRRDAVEQQLALLIKRTMSYRADREPSPATAIDSLTGLANRQGLQVYVAQRLALSDAEEPLCIILFDLDNFKYINDSRGHLDGDRALAEIGRLLRQYALGGGLVARIGGDEFVVAMRASLEQGRAFAEFLRTQMEMYEISLDDRPPILITGSFGVVSNNGHSSYEELLRHADQCLYAAKEKGRNCVVTAMDASALADAAGQDTLINDFENRIRVMTERMTNELVLKARRLARQYRAEADRDGLTGIFNRRHLDRLLSRELEKSQRLGKRLTVALLDLDHFGEINRTYGFPTGDRALKAAAAVIQESVRALDWVARYGGEEFCIVMPDTVLDAGCQVGERIRQALSAEIVEAYDGRRFQVTASIGVIELTPEDADAVALFQRASDRVREAKKGGRNQIRY